MQKREKHGQLHTTLLANGILTIDLHRGEQCTKDVDFLRKGMLEIYKLAHKGGSETLADGIRPIADYPYDETDASLWLVNGKDVGIRCIFDALNGWLAKSTRSSFALKYDEKVKLWRLPSLGFLSGFSDRYEFEHALTRVRAVN